MSKVVIIVEGGNVQSVTSSEPLEVVIVDRDTEGVDLVELKTIDEEEAYVYEGITQSDVIPDYVKRVYAEAGR